jgi:hypothetical protein
MTSAGSYCRYCGTEIEPSSKFCSNCGKPTSLPAGPTTGAGMGSSNEVGKKTHKKAIVGIVAITLIFALAVVYASVSTASNPSRSALDDPQILIQEVGAYMSQQGWEYPQQVGDRNMTRVAEEIIKSKNLENSAIVVIVAQRLDDCWSGSVMGSDNIQTTEDGCNTAYFSIPCGLFGSYSLAMQRSNEGDGLPFTIPVWKGGNLLKQAETTADYGVVTFAGGCSGG